MLEFDLECSRMGDCKTNIGAPENENRLGHFAEICLYVCMNLKCEVVLASVSRGV